jgi:hypothetical protein
MRKKLVKPRLSEVFVVMAYFGVDDTQPLGVFVSEKEAELRSRVYFKSNPGVKTYVMAVPFGFLANQDSEE